MKNNNQPANDHDLEVYVEFAGRLVSVSEYNLLSKKKWRPNPPVRKAKYCVEQSPSSYNKVMKVINYSEFVKDVHSSHDARKCLANLRDIAAQNGEDSLRNVYDLALFYFNTGRLSAACEKALIADFINVCVELQQFRSYDYETIYDNVGNYLKNFPQELTNKPRRIRNGLSLMHHPGKEKAPVAVSL